MADCKFSTMEWYCCLQEGHEGDHESRPLSEHRHAMNKLSDEEQKEYENLIDSLTKGELNGVSKSPDEQMMEIVFLGIKFGERRNADSGGEKERMRAEIQIYSAHKYGAFRNQDCEVNKCEDCKKDLNFLREAVLVMREELYGANYSKEFKERLDRWYEIASKSV